MRRVAVTAPLEARVVAGASLLAAQLQRIAAIVVAMPVYAAVVLVAACASGWRHRRAGLRQLRRSAVPLYFSLTAVAVVVGWIVASH